MQYLNPKYATICVCILLFLSSTSFAHGELTARINEKTAQIKLDPENSELHFARGFLYQQHKEYNKALKDYLKAEDLGYDNLLLYYRKAEVFQLLSDYESAIESIEYFLSVNSKPVKANKLKAQILANQQKYSQALESYNYVLENTIDIRPQEYIEYCNILLNNQPNNYDRAIAILDQGLQKLGENNLSLRLQKIEYLKASNNSEQAIAEYNYFISTSERKESWYYNKAEYLYDLKKFSEANIALQQAKISIELLSPKFQQTQNIKELSQKINNLESNLKL